MIFSFLPDLSSLEQGYRNQDKGGRVNQAVNAAGSYIADCYFAALLINGIANPEYLKAWNYYFTYFSPQMSLGKPAENVIADKTKKEQSDA